MIDSSLPTTTTTTSSMQPSTPFTIPTIPPKLLRFRRIILALSIFPLILVIFGCHIWDPETAYCSEPAPDDFYPLVVFIPGTLLYIIRVFYRPMFRVDRQGAAWLTFLLYFGLFGWNIALLIMKGHVDEWRVMSASVSFVLLSILAMVESMLTFRFFVQFIQMDKAPGSWSVTRDEFTALEGIEEGRKVEEDQGKLEYAMELIQIQQQQIQQLLNNGSAPPAYGLDVRGGGQGATADGVHEATLIHVGDSYCESDKKKEALGDVNVASVWVQDGGRGEGSNSRTAGP